MLKIIEHGDVCELRLDHPPANALTPELITALGEAARRAPKEGARALVLSGREGMFSAGLDVPHFLTLDLDGVRNAWRRFFDLMETLAGSPIPVAAALTGHSPAGGCVLALCCDWRVIAAGKYKIGLNEVQVGLRMPRPILAVARHVLGTRQAERLCTTATLVDVDEAYRIGLVDEVVPDSEVIPRAIAWARQMIALPPNALAKTRVLSRRDLMRTFEAMDEEQLELFMDEWFSEETQGAMKALVERLAAKS